MSDAIDLTKCLACGQPIRSPWWECYDCGGCCCEGCKHGGALVEFVVREIPRLRCRRCVEDADAWKRDIAKAGSGTRRIAT